MGGDFHPRLLVLISRYRTREKSDLFNRESKHLGRTRIWVVYPDPDVLRIL